MRKVAISGLAVAAMLGGVATTALAPPASAATKTTAAAAGRVRPPLPPAAAALKLGSPAGDSITTENDLLGVSCYTTARCVAVGEDKSGTSNVPESLAESWNGKAWSRTPGTINVPPGTVGDVLASVSCRSTTLCVAVGAYYTASSGAGLAEVWNGATNTWTDSTGLTAPGDYSILYGVSCVNTHRCVAVGRNSTDGQTVTPVADVWNGTAWTMTSAPEVPSGAFSTTLSAVSCWTGTKCIAVGTYQTGSYGNTTGVGALIEKWNGRSWTIIEAASPPGNVADGLTGISCLSAKDCTAVGGFVNTSGRFEGFGEHWNGSAWQASTAPWSSGSGDSILYSVSCLSSGDCNATGVEEFVRNSNIADTGKAAAAHWNGAGWKVTSPAAIPNADDALNAVSCKTANFCSAVGMYGPENSDDAAGLSAFWHHTRWKLIDAI